jgi:pimeloyl-ACP methyl ester carboxylesterase
MIVNYYEKGLKGNPVVVFIHGSASDATVWLNELNLLAAKGYHCIALDLRGHGETRLMPQPKAQVKIDIDTHINDLIETLEHLGIFPKEKITIVTHSFGGIVAINFAEQYPDLVAKLILICLPPKLISPVKDFLRILLGSPLKIIQANLNLFQKTPLRARYKSSIMTNADVLREIYQHVKNWNGLRKIPKLQAKIFLAAARFDFVAPAYLIYKVHELTSGSEFQLFKWSGHALMEDQPEEFRHWLLDCVAA